jgi:hypothetical protein
MIAVIVRVTRPSAENITRSVSFTQSSVFIGPLAEWFGRKIGLVQAGTQLVQFDTPPFERGATWSIISSSLPGCSPQYWHA